MTGALDEARLVDLARRLKGAETGDWSGAALRPLAEDLDQRRNGADASAWAVRLRSVGRFERDFVPDGQEYVGLYVPVAVPEGGAAGKAAAFRDAAQILTKEFGPAPIMGVYGDPGPFYDSAPLWGSPFLRWRDREDTLELHAGEHGPELLLQPTEPVENWFWRQGHGEHHAIGGFFGTRQDPANAGLGFPGRWRTDDWDVFAGALGDFLTTLPAETTALGIELDLGFHALVPGTYGPILFHLSCGERLEIVYDTEPLGADITDPASFGWIAQATRPAALDHWLECPYHSGDFGIGEVDGRALGRMIVDTLRDLGVESPKQLSLSDHAQRVGEYRVDYYGLTLQENP
ncbi:hypothetical protein HUT19_35650 [Streptomyces sp. NA02950]|uniref:hypothetical protein n=1 Tax=Streptomyces sp. NA02950 TaxID=2742137 RepID=UPI0015908028|nr:hypothetical protein [Streptomyces sp. NA02950]QKV96386.1 hypothetical protein HUT19_35650 [Streptomyces sp. NA02950]